MPIFFLFKTLFLKDDLTHPLSLKLVFYKLINKSYKPINKKNFFFGPKSLGLQCLSKRLYDENQSYSSFE